MKLLIILPSTHRGGNEEHALTIARAALNEEWEVHAAFPAVEGLRTLAADVQRLGIVLHDLDLSERYVRRMRLLRVDGKNFFLTHRLLSRVAPDVVMIDLPWHTWGLGSMLACAWSGVPTAVIFQLVAPAIEIRQETKAVYRWAHTRRQTWIAVSNNNRMLLANAFGVATDSIKLIYNGTRVSVSDGRSRQEQAALRREVREELDIKPHATIVLSVGRLSRQKGYALFLPILVDVLNAFPSVHFVWVGDGEERSSLEDELDARHLREHVLLLGHRNDVYRLFEAADLFVLPTLFEGHPFSLLEAMAHGVPVIASDASGIPEILQHEVHGIVFPAGSSEALKGALLDALRNPTKMRRLAEAAAIRARDFTEEQMVSQTMNVLRSLARESLHRTT